MQVQNTLKSAVTFRGRGLHSGAPVLMVVRPASVDYGIWFRRTDLTQGDSLIPHKARILLMLGLTKTKDPKDLQRMFNEY